MWYVGIDLSWRTSMVAMVSEEGEHVRPRRFRNRDPGEMVEFVSSYKPFRAVIEATSSYRWLYDLLSEHGEVVLAHPLRLRAIWSGKAKTDKLDAKVLAELLRGGLIPTSYVPPKHYQALRELTRARAKLVRARTSVKNQLHTILARANIESPFKSLFGPRGLRWMSLLRLDPVTGVVRDEHVERIRYFDRAIAEMDSRIGQTAPEFPQVEALSCLYGFGVYSALLVIAEFGEPRRFKRAGQAAAYCGLTARVKQSGKYERRGRISKEGSSWLRWVLCEAAMKVIRRDEALRRFHQRVRRRSNKFVARVAVARKLAEICWKRLMAWHEAHPAA